MDVAAGFTAELPKLQLLAAATQVQISRLLARQAVDAEGVT